MLLLSSLAAAQQASPPSTSADRAGPTTGKAPSAEDQRAMKLAQVLNPEDYGPAFNAGAQAELIVPSIGASAILVGYDAVWMRADLSLGFGIGDDVEQEQDVRDLYITGLRLALPLHRGVREDFSLLVAGGVTFFHPVEGENSALVSTGVGASFRSFLSPNLAVVGTFGVLVFFHDDSWALIGGARPLGSAAFVYYFR
jgi:hypothetical protein